MFIDDTTGILKGQTIDLTSPFDVKVVVTSTSSKAALDAQVSNMVNSANTLAIGVDPVHHYTFTHFGVGTGIPRERYQDVARAGNGEFKAGHWGDGIRAIVSNATAARTATSATTTIVVPTQQTVVEHPFPMLPFVLGAAALALGFFLLWRWNKRKTSALMGAVNDLRDEAGQLRSRNIEEQAWHDKMAARQEPSSGSSPLRGAPNVHHYHQMQGAAPVIVNSGGNDLLTGVLIGESLNRPVERERVIERHYSPPAYESSSSSSSSSWDSGSSSSFDSGSGGGDFGGGFDGGGGGGDF